MSISPEPSGGSPHIADPADAGVNWGNVAAGFAAASIVYPFVQSFMSRAGEDAYQAVRNLIRRGVLSREQVNLHLISTDTFLIWEPPLPDEAIEQLASVSPELIRGQVGTWDADAGMWVWRTRKPFIPGKAAPEIRELGSPDPWDDHGGLA
jgi:hypothetical protein